MANKNFKKIAKELARNSIIFKGYPHRRHRKKPKSLASGKKELINKAIDAEHDAMISNAT